MKFYKIVDEYHEFADGELFESQAEVIEQLADYHSIDWSGEDDKGAPISIEDYLTSLPGETARLNFLLEHGGWELEQVEGIKCPLCGHPIEAKSAGRTPFWSCPEACPFVAFEFDTAEDLENLTKELNR